MVRELDREVPNPCGRTGELSREVICDAVERYDLQYMQDMVNKAVRGIRIEPGVLEFFHDFAAYSEHTNPDFDLAQEYGQLAVKIDAILDFRQS